MKKISAPATAQNLIIETDFNQGVFAPWNPGASEPK